MKKTNEINAFLGENTEFEGKLSFKGAVRIDGRFKGEIHSDGTLVVGEKAVLHSDIRVSYVIISGEVHGSIAAERKIEIHAPAKVFGNIDCPLLGIEEGVVFEGECSMSARRELSGVEEKETAIEG